MHSHWIISLIYYSVCNS